MKILLIILAVLLLSACNSGPLPVPVNDTIIEVDVQSLAEAVKFLGGGIVLAAAILGAAGFFTNRN